MRGQVIKRGEKKYMVRVPRGRDADGKRLYHNHTVHGTKRDAQEYLAKVVREMSTGAFVEPSKESVGNYLQQWLSTTVALRVKERTAESYRSLTVAYLLPTLGALKLSQLTPNVIEKTYADLVKDDLSPRTVRYAHSVLHSALQTAVDRKHLAINPAAQATLPRMKHSEMKAMTKEEATALLEAARGTRLEALWVVLLSGGLRPGEALGLKWSDLTDDRLRIQRSLVRLRDHSWRLEDPKTARARRSVPLPASALMLLRAHRTAQLEERLKAGPEWADHDLIFCTSTGAPLEWRVVARRYFKALLKAAGLKDFRPYDLRHTCATLLLLSGEHPKVVSERLGHSSISLTLDIYSHVLPDMQQQAAEKLEAMLFA